MRTLEAQLHPPSADESDAAGSVSAQGSPRPRSPALPPLDSHYDARKLMSPTSTASTLLSPYANGSPAMPQMRRRKSGRRRSPSVAGSHKSRGTDADDDDEVQILLSAPSSLARSVMSDEPECGLGLEWEAGTSASSVGEDYVGHVPAMFARPGDPSLRLQPATPTDPASLTH